MGPDQRESACAVEKMGTDQRENALVVENMGPDQRENRFAVDQPGRSGIPAGMLLPAPGVLPDTRGRKEQYFD